MPCKCRSGTGERPGLVPTLNYLNPMFNSLCLKAMNYTFSLEIRHISVWEMNGSVLAFVSSEKKTFLLWRSNLSCCALMEASEVMRKRWKKCPSHDCCFLKTPYPPNSPPANFVSRLMQEKYHLTFVPIFRVLMKIHTYNFTKSREYIALPTVRI